MGRVSSPVGPTSDPRWRADAQCERARTGCTWPPSEESQMPRLVPGELARGTSVGAISQKDLS